VLGGKGRPDPRGESSVVSGVQKQT